MQAEWADGRQGGRASEYSNSKKKIKKKRFAIPVNSSPTAKLDAPSHLLPSKRLGGEPEWATYSTVFRSGRWE